MTSLDGTPWSMLVSCQSKGTDMRDAMMTNGVLGYGGEGAKPEPAKPKPAEAPKDAPKPEKKDGQ